VPRLHVTELAPTVHVPGTVRLLSDETAGVRRVAVLRRGAEIHMRCPGAAGRIGWAAWRGPFLRGTVPRESEKARMGGLG
jgi:hypothetical protein